jgi:hypothetical protein
MGLPTPSEGTTLQAQFSCPALKPTGGLQPACARSAPPAYSLSGRGIPAIGDQAERIPGFDWSQRLALAMHRERPPRRPCG